MGIPRLSCIKNRNHANQIKTWFFFLLNDGCINVLFIIAFVISVKWSLNYLLVVFEKVSFITSASSIFSLINIFRNTLKSRKKTSNESLNVSQNLFVFSSTFTLHKMLYVYFFTFNECLSGIPRNLQVQWSECMNIVVCGILRCCSF